MNERNSKGQRLMALFLVGCLLFSYPLLAIFSQDKMVWGIPILYVYIFLAWAILIGLMTLVIER